MLREQLLKRELLLVVVVLYYMLHKTLIKLKLKVMIKKLVLKL